MALHLRALTDDEVTAVTRLAQSRTAAARAVERARIILTAHRGERAPAIAARLGLHAKTVRRWLTRFNAAGVAGLADAPRAGRPATYTAEEVGTVVATALTDPRALGQPFACWTYDRLAAYLNEVVGLPIKRSRINELLLAEGLRWRQQEGWFGERADPEFAEKRGRSSSSTPLRPPTASSPA